MSGAAHYVSPFAQARMQNGRGYLKAVAASPRQQTHSLVAREPQLDRWPRPIRD